MDEIIRRQRWPTEAEMKQDLLHHIRDAQRLTDLLQQPWPPAAGPPAERLDESTREDVLLEISGLIPSRGHR